MASWPEIVHFVEQRADGRCEYCRMHQSLQGATFHVEHIIPRSAGGNTELHNLAWCCPSCNLHKSSRRTAIDPLSGELKSLYNPRSEVWDDHFAWEQYVLVGITATGRAAVSALHMNEPRRLLIRHAEAMFGLFAP